jgi:hypothetical protein
MTETFSKDDVALISPLVEKDSVHRGRNAEHEHFGAVVCRLAGGLKVRGAAIPENEHRKDERRTNPPQT